MFTSFLFAGNNLKRPVLRDVALAFLATVIAIGGLSLLGTGLGVILLMGSFGASCVLLFGYPDSPFCRPSCVILGHFLSTMVGLCFLHLLGPSWWSLALAAGTSLAVMLLTRQVHPPAGSNAVIVFLSQPGWGFAFFPTLAGAVLLVALAWCWRYWKTRALKA